MTLKFAKPKAVPAQLTDVTRYQHIAVCLVATRSSPNIDPDTGLQRMDNLGYGIISTQASRRVFVDRWARDIGPDAVFYERGADRDAKWEASKTKLFIDRRLFGGPVPKTNNVGTIAMPEMISVVPIDENSNVVLRGLTSTTHLAEDKNARENEAHDVEDDENPRKRANMGHKAVIEHGAFRGDWTVHPVEAVKNKTTSDDLKRFMEAIPSVWADVHTVVRASQEMRLAVVFSFETADAPEPSWRTRDRVKITPKVEIPHGWEDYEVTIDTANLPEGTLVYDVVNANVLASV